MARVKEGNLDTAIRECIELALKEWRQMYPQFIEIQVRLKQLSYGIRGLAANHGIDLAEEEVSQMNGFTRDVPRRIRKSHVAAVIESRSRPCPKCRAAEGQPCVIMLPKYRGKNMPTITHKARLTAKGAN